MILRESCSHGCRPWSSTVTEQDGVIVVRAPPASEPVPFPGRGALTGQVDGFSRPDGRGRAWGIRMHAAPHRHHVSFIAATR